MRLSAARAVVRYIIRPQQSETEITALCHLWLCVVATLDKTDNGAEWRISARSVSELLLDWDRSDSLKSVPVQSQYEDRCVLY